MARCGRVGSSTMITRRSLLQGASAASLAAVLDNKVMAQTGARGKSNRTTAAGSGKSFSQGFLWGCATTGYQVEGSNVESDTWTLEHLPESVFKEPSGDACDHYHLYPQDIS